MVDFKVKEGAEMCPVDMEEGREEAREDCSACFFLEGDREKTMPPTPPPLLPLPPLLLLLAATDFTTDVSMVMQA